MKTLSKHSFFLQIRILPNCKQILPIFISLFFLLGATNSISGQYAFYAVNDFGDIVGINAPNTTWLQRLLHPNNTGWWMYAGGSPKNPVTDKAYVVIRVGEVREITPSGSFTVLANLSSYASNGWYYPMVRSTSGTLYALNFWGKLAKITASGASLVTDLSSYSATWGRITIDSNDNLYAMGANGIAIKISPGGTVTQIANAGSVSSNQWSKVILGPDQYYYLINLDGKIAKANVCGATLFADLDLINGNTDNEWSNFAFHPNGNLYAVNINDGQVAEIQLSGATSIITQYIARAWYGPVIDQNGNIHVWNNNNVFRIISSTGQVLQNFGIGTRSYGWYSIALDQFVINSTPPGPNCNNPPNCANAAIANQNADENCQATISGSDVTGVTDPDGDPLTISVNPTLLNLGANTVAVTANDGNGGSCTINITVNVVDNDSDNDGVADCMDNCPNTVNANQLDADCDGVGDACDLCDGGDDSIDNNNDGLPDCAYFPGMSHLESSWKCGNNNNKVFICHIPPGNPANAQTNCVSPNAVAAHLGHGDYVGPCGNANCSQALQGIGPNETNAGFVEQVFTLFPNPAKDVLHISLTGFDEEAIEISIVNSLGIQIWHQNVNSENSELKVELTSSKYENGLYLVLLKTKEKLFTEPFILMK